MLFIPQKNKVTRRTSAFKGEWLTVKNGFLYCGGHGKEATTPTGAFRDSNSMYVKRISHDGVVESENWVQRYIALRAAIQIRYPGYVIHEAVQWSDRWFFLPRHLSKLAYNPDTVEETGANVLLSASEDFTDFTAVMVGHEVHTRGFSAFQFVQGTNDTIIVAVKSQELGQLPFSSYMMVFTIYGRIIMDETLVPGQIKYEGIEFLNKEELEHFVAYPPMFA
ncbi:Apyrase [Cooperia oncophora]